MNTSRLIPISISLMLMATAVISVSAQNISPHNPGIFQNYATPPSPMLRFLASEQGKQALLHSPNPNAKKWLMRFHPDAVALYPQYPLLRSIRRSEAPLAAVSGCGTASGTRMNLEPALNAMPQLSPQVDFLLSALGTGLDLVVEHGNDLRGLGNFGGMSAIYVHRDPTQACYGGTDFELGNPPIANPLVSGQTLPAAGDPKVITDPDRQQVVLADVRLDANVSGVGLRRIPITNFKSTVICPAGTQTNTQATACVGSNAVVVAASMLDMLDAPSIAQDPRSTGIGSGNIYIANTLFGGLYGNSVVQLTACKGDFASVANCSPPIIISGPQSRAQLSNVAVVPAGGNAGKITIAYMNGTTDIEFVVCTPNGAPVAPSCSAPMLVASEANALLGWWGNTSLTNNPYVAAQTAPQIANRYTAAGQTTVVVWARCKTALNVLPYGSACPDSDIVMAQSTNLGVGWTKTNVNISSSHDFAPAIAYDSGQNIINIAHYHSTDTYKNRVVVHLRQILPGATAVGPVITVTTSADSTAGDANGNYYYPYSYGDPLGLAAHGGSAAGSGRVYVGFTSNSRLGSYGGVQNTESNNHLSRVTY